MRARLIPFALLVACSSGNGAPPATTPLPAPATPPAPAPATTATGSELVVVRHASTAAAAGFQELDLAPMLARGAAPVRGLSFERTAIPVPQWEGHFDIRAAHDGTDLVIASRSAGGAPVLVHRVLGRAEEREVSVGDRGATALLVRGRVAIVGAGDRVGTVDLRERTLSFTQVHQRTLNERKAFDLIVANGDWLVAVDDMVMPLWADSFAVDASGRLTHRAGWELPGVINGSYVMGALIGSGGDGTLILGAPYSIMDGHGHDLVALGVHGHAVQALPERLVLQNAHGTPGTPPVLEEHVPRGRPGSVLTLHGGTAFSEWTAMAVVGRDTPAPELVFAAGARGLMVLPASFGENSTATLVDVGGHCLDVVARGDALVALIGDAPPDPYVAPPTTAPPPASPSKLVLVRREAGGLRAVATHVLDAAYTGLVH